LLDNKDANAKAALEKARDAAKKSFDTGKTALDAVEGTLAPLKAEYERRTERATAEKTAKTKKDGAAALAKDKITKALAVTNKRAALAKATDPKVKAKLTKELEDVQHAEEQMNL